MPIIDDSFLQGSGEWFAARAGNPGASGMNKIITSRGEPSKQAQDYLYQLAGEYITGKCEETFQSLHMKEGLIRESKARMTFELVNLFEVRQVGIVFADDRSCHASPDGLIGETEGLEIKCPMMKTHIRYLLDGKLPTDYFVQVQSSMFICSRPVWWFISWYPGLDPFTIKVEADLRFHVKLKELLEEFCFNLAVMVRKLKELN